MSREKEVITKILWVVLWAIVLLANAVAWGHFIHNIALCILEGFTVGILSSIYFVPKLFN